MVAFACMLLLLVLWKPFNCADFYEGLKFDEADASMGGRRGAVARRPLRLLSLLSVAWPCGPAGQMTTCLMWGASSLGTGGTFQGSEEGLLAASAAGHSL